MKKTNCWEHQQCGREPRGANHERGVCPAATEASLDGTHGGLNAGRSCWVVTGTLCNGQKQGAFAAKYMTCESCSFYNAVENEEGPAFKNSSMLLGKMREART